MGPTPVPGRPRNHRAGFAVAAAMALLDSCNMSSYSDLAEPINPYDPVGASGISFIRADTLAGVSTASWFTLAEPALPTGGAIALIDVISNWAEVRAVVHRGSYRRIGDTLVLDIMATYSNSYKSNANPGAGTGVTVVEYSPAHRRTHRFARSSDGDTATLDDRSHVSVEVVLESVLSDTSSDRYEWFLRLYQLSVISSHTRVEGFGGIGMFQYIGRASRFEGLISGTMEIEAGSVNDGIETRFDYASYCDMAGVTLQGTLANVSDFDGNGNLGGTISFSARSGSRTWTGTVGYGRVVLTHTQPSTGAYVVTLDGVAHDVRFDFGNPGQFGLTGIPGL